MTAKDTEVQEIPDAVPTAAQNGIAATIARIAYEKWQARGCPEGDDLRDWLDAEREVTGAAARQSTAPVAGPQPTKRGDHAPRRS